jgi:DNA-binding NarL/FixJ family response regulator
VLMDLQLPHMDGIATTKALHTVCPHVPVILLTIHDSAAVRAGAASAGVSAFVTKHASANELLAAIRRVAA